MEIAMLAIRPALSKLGELLVGEFTLEKRMKKCIESLITELTLMHAALSKVAKVPPEQLDEDVKIWSGKVKELSYHMEDIVDAFVVRVEDGGEHANPKNKVKKLLKKTIKLFKKGKDLHRISDALEEVVCEAKQLAEMRQRYQLEMRDINAGASVDPRMMALYTDVTELVGIEESRDELINMLIECEDWSKNPLKTVSIVGFGGLGKTTLAKVVYDKIKVQFDCCAFVSVSRNPDMKTILKDILFELDKIKYSDIHNASRQVNHLIDEIIEFLKDKRYLVVIDDLWDETAWQFIKCIFSKNSLGSRLITTTRITNISEACSSSSLYIYKMKSLSDDVSKRLFYKRVFSHGKGCPEELVEVSEHILKKCGGIPLAIVTIASILAKRNHHQWYDVLNSIGRGLTEDRSAKEMWKILLFSYYDLPDYLKPCLLYLSTFPEDHKIKRANLILKWISEGFVYSENEETSLYELGDRYFNELVNRNMIQPTGIDNEEKIEACHVHDMVLDLICSLASENNFATILDGTERKMPNSPRRLSIQNSKVDLATINMEQVRSISIFTDDDVDQLNFFSSCLVLRVLDLKYRHILDTGNLLHLRYLGLNHPGVKELPMEIGRLRLLQILNIRGTSINELSSSVVRLRHLMYLGIPVGTKLPSGIGNLTSLEVLHGPLVEGNFNHHLVEELGHLTKLRVLLFGLGDLDESMCTTLVGSLSNLHKLESLDIFSQDGCTDLMPEGWKPYRQLSRLYTVGCSFRTLPAWINASSLPLLSSLILTVSKVRSEDIQLLGTLPALRYVNLRDGGNYPGERMVKMFVATAEAFPCATECYFFDIAAVPSIFPQGAAPRLKSLIFGFPVAWISNADIDLSMGHLPFLEMVSVTLFIKEATNEEVNEADAALRAAAEDHPNRPKLSIVRW